MTLYRVKLPGGKTIAVRRLGKNRVFGTKCYKCGDEIQRGHTFGIQQNGITEIRFCTVCLGEPVQERDSSD